MKLPNTTGLNLATRAAGTELAIDGRPLPLPGAPDLAVPLAVWAPTTGFYTLEVAQLLNLPVGTRVYLRDRQTGALLDLQQQPRYNFTLEAAATAPRFELLFRQPQALGTGAASLAAQVALYPNPARQSVTVALPGALNQQPVTAEIMDALGRVVRQQVLAPGQNAHTLPLANVPAGVYALRLHTAAGTLTKRLVVE